MKSPEQGVEHKTAEIEGPKAREIHDRFSLESYVEWSHDVPFEIRRLVESSMKGSVPSPQETGLPLTDQFLTSLSASFQQGKVVSAENPLIKNLIEPLARISTEVGYLDVFETMVNPDVSWNLKRTLYDTQIRPALEWLVERDLREAIPESSDEESSSGEAPDENDVPPSGEQVTSSMESDTEKKEGAPTPLFSVRPFYGGYAKQSTFSTYDISTHSWVVPERTLEVSSTDAMETILARKMQGKIRGGQPLALPIYYDWTVSPESIETDAPPEAVKLERSADGGWFLTIDSPGVWNYSLTIGRREWHEGGRSSRVEISGGIPKPLLQKINELKASGLPSLAAARGLVKFIRDHLEYSNSSEAWRSYVNKGDGFFEEVWKRKEADCHVANTLAVRALMEIDPRVRFVGGFFVKEKSEDDAAIMHSGNGHAWLEIWDAHSGRWVRLDATPKGDPTLDEEVQEHDLEGEGGEGDYGGGDDLLFSEDELAEAKKQFGQGGGGRSRTSSYERTEYSFSQSAECTPEQAREFLRALERVREITDREGQRVAERLIEEWKAIVEEHRIIGREYQGPVRMSEGDRLEDPISAVIDVRAKEFNPTGFERDEKTEKVETDFGGINLYFSFDLSGSMSEPDRGSGRSKADVQRDVALLFVDSLMQCAFLSRREEESTTPPVKLMVTLASGHGEVRLPLTDQWGPKEQWAFYSALNKVASGSTPTHETLALIKEAHETENNILTEKRIPKDKRPLDYVVEITDGVPDDQSSTTELHKEITESGAALRSYVVGGSGYDEFAESVGSFADLPEILAKDVIEQFKKIRPRKIKI
jgi:hypothetical protein